MVDISFATILVVQREKQTVHMADVPASKHKIDVWGVVIAIQPVFMKKLSISGE